MRILQLVRLKPFETTRGTLSSADHSYIAWRNIGFSTSRFLLALHLFLPLSYLTCIIIHSTSLATISQILPPGPHNPLFKHWTPQHLLHALKRVHRRLDPRLKDLPEKQSNRLLRLRARGIVGYGTGSGRRAFEARRGGRGSGG